MSGERAAYFAEIAERGEQRVMERLVMISDRYGKPIDPTDDVITFAEMMQHYADTGHNPGMDENCTDPICGRAKKMIAGALVALQQMPPQGGQQ